VLRNTARRRSASIALLVGGGVLAWAVTPGAIGYVLLGLGVVLEVAGILVERRAGR